MNHKYPRARHSLFCAAIALPVLFSLGSPSKADVDLREGSLEIPTYLVKPPNPMPRFYEGESHQGVQRRMYPYPMNDNLTNIKEDRPYHIVELENEYIDLDIMPGLGGRIYSAQDKTNDYDWFYKNNVIKPSLIGMIGYWISGSNAWGFPHHHGPNTVKPMDYKVVEHEDGSTTVWIANTDRRHRMRVIVGYTIYPDSSLVDMTIRPMNPTPLVNSFLFWANPSVHVNTDYQVIFPPSVRYATQHAKREMTTWPVADRRYNRYDYEGVNISWWKDIGVPSSFFSWDPRENFFGGYDHGKQAGTVWVGNRHTSPGMKFWAWGNNPGGDRANAGLTDDDGHYIELMAGAYTDNQPDYSWMQPYETKDVTMTWFPVRELGGLKYANREGALNLEVQNQSAAVRINTTSPHKNAVVTLKTGQDVLLKETIRISPAQPFAADVELPAGTTEDDLELSVTEATGEILLTYRPADYKPSNDPMPEPLEPPKAPENIETVEELYLTGLRLNQFYNASLDPMPYYREALQRDPGNYNVTTQLGILAIKDKNWEAAEAYLQTAVDRITRNYTRARDGEAQYYLGFVHKAQGHLQKAYDLLYASAWSAAWHTPAYYQLAEIDARRGEYETALAHVNRAISTGTGNLRALNLKAVILGKLGQHEKALAQADAILQTDVLNHQAANERVLNLRATGKANAASEQLADLSELMRDQVQSYLELAVTYGNAGFYAEASDLLGRLKEKGETYPMLHYYLGYYSGQQNHTDKALEHYNAAAEMPHTYSFPFRWESVQVLNHAMQVNPTDAKAPYYLGNLFYEHQPEKALALWEKSRELDDSFYIVHRNLAQAYEEIQGDVKKAIKSMERAVSANSEDPRLLFEMDELYEKNKASPQKKYALLKDNEETVGKRNESLLRLATRSVQVGKYDEALEILLNNEFPQFEGGTEKQDTYLNALTLRGLEFFEEDDYDNALEDFATAMTYPVGRWGRSRWAQFHYLSGLTHEKLGNTNQAEESFQKSLDVAVDEQGTDQQYGYYQGLALQKLGNHKQAKKLFEALLASAQSQDDDRFFRQFEGEISLDQQKAANQFLAGLAYQGLGKDRKAQKAFEQTLELDPDHVWARYHLP
mgnify:CR=1 FL=1